jgi:site-specific recombinase XerD
MGGDLTFEDYLGRVRGKSARTVAEYLRDAASFEAWCDKRGQEAAASITRARVGLYLMDRMSGSDKTKDAESISSRSAARAVSALKSYGQYLVFAGKLDKANLEELRSPRYSRTLPAYFNAEEIRSIVCAFDDDKTPRGVRNAAILHLLYAAGLRVSECAGLRLNSLQHGERIVTVFGKGSRERQVPYGERAATAIARYLDASRLQLATDKSADWLWLNVRGGRLTARAMRTILDQAALRAGSIKPISPHKLRHACATHMLEGGADVRLLQELLGHQSINTTQVYTQITRTHLLDAYERAHPRANKG